MVLTEPHDVDLSSFRALKRRARDLRRDAVNARAFSLVNPQEIRDPSVLDDERPRALRGMLSASSASVAFHVAVVAMAAIVARMTVAPPRDSDVPVTIRFVAPPVPAAEEPPPEPPTPTAPLPAALPIVRKVQAPLKDDTVPPTPIDVPEPTEPAPVVAKDPPRRVVGMSSTVVGGGGPAFAAGNTLMGRTSEVAGDPIAAGGLAADSTPPRRLSAPRPEYPAALKEHGVEGAVVVRAEIDPSGRVTAVAVVEPSPHDEFNRAAVDAASRSTYQPARANGVPVARAIEFTVRFRLHE